MTSQATASGADARRGGRDLTTGSIPRHVLAFALPMLAGNLLQTAYSFVNAFWVGKFLGTAALAAVTVSMPVVFVTFALAGGLTLATNVLVAQYFGAKDYPRVRSAVQTSVALIGLVSVLLLAVGLSLSGAMLRTINTPADILAAADGYLRIMLWSVPLSFAIFLIGSMLRGIGDSQTPVYFQAVSVVVNAVLDPLLMFGWLGFPRLGLNGTACATLIAQSGAVIGLLLYIPRKRPLVAPDWRHLRVDRPTGWLLVRIGVPAMIQQSVVSVSMLVITSFVSAFGTLADAAFGAALRIDMVAFLPAMTVGVAIATLAGQNIGAGKLARVRGVFWWGMLLSGGISLVIAGLAVGLPRVWLRAFLDDPQAIAIGSGYLRIVGFTYALYAAMFISHGVINGSGHTTVTTLISIVTLWGIRLPLAAALSRSLHTETGIWYAMLVSVASSMLLSQAYYFSGRWKRPVVRRDNR
jgi:putative MATE family efflux protein